MNKTQIDNLIQFCFLFHPSFDCDWSKQSPDYIKEKWNKYIGINVTSDEFDRSYFTNNTVNWIKTWKVSNEDWSQLKRVIRFIISLSLQSSHFSHLTQGICNEVELISFANFVNVSASNSK